MKTTLLILGILFGSVTTLARPAQAQTLGRFEVVDVAKDVELLADDLVHELQRYERDPRMRAALRDADRLYRAAEHLHDLVNVNIGERGYVRSDRAREIAQYSRTVEQLLARVQDQLGLAPLDQHVHRSPFDRHDHRGYRHSAAYRSPVPGRIERKARALEDATHLLLSDLRQGL